MSIIEDRVCEQIQSRAKVGLDKYGVSLENGDYSLPELLQHTQDELMDGANYIESIKDLLNNKPIARVIEVNEHGDVEQFCTGWEKYSRAKDDFEYYTKAYPNSKFVIVLKDIIETGAY